MPIRRNNKEDKAMKAFGLLMIGAMAVAGGIAAATYITKKKLDRENEDNYYDDWDNDSIDDDWDFDFDEDMEVEDEPAYTKPAEDESSSIPEAKSSPFSSSDIFSADSLGGEINGDDMR